MGRPKGFKMSERSKQKTSLSMIGIVRSEETRKKMSKSFRGKILSEEMKERKAAARKNNTITREEELNIKRRAAKYNLTSSGPYNLIFEEEKQKNKAPHGLLGTHWSEERKANCSAHPPIRKPHTEETKKKLRQYKRSPEVRKQISQSHKGMKATWKTRQIMVEAQAKRRERERMEGMT